MSDGPHRSLPMRKGWKKLAERGDGTLHSDEQVRDAVPLALTDDWREERCDDFMNHVKDVLLGSNQDTLFQIPRMKQSMLSESCPVPAIPCGEFSPTH